MVVSTLLFAVLWTFVKDLSQRYPVYEVTFFRNFFALLPVMLMLAARGSWGMLRVRRIAGHVWRAVIGVTAMVLGFLSYHLMPLADAVAISFMSPLLITALSVPLLGERVGLHRWAAVLVGFVGVLIIVDPGRGMLTPGVLVALASAAATALAMITIRQLNKSDPPLAIVFYFTVFSSIFTALPLPFLWVTPSGADWVKLVVMGLTGGIGQYFMTRAFGLAPAAVVSPFNYAGLLWATLFGWILWNEVPQPHVLGGAVIVIASGLYILYRETRKERPADMAG
ncbi:DMT family transporter [Rhodovastum atsumiense]|uniref:DMT family transporter n=1 Tax=Rhodovastum atsumiense TaxID=504468 RepID=A0A5M6IWE4_9PROT|nr:DMT family transporter [Rhodovastum atsumiense]